MYKRVFKRKNKKVIYWYADFWHNGIRYRKSFGEVSKSQAKEKEGAWKRDIRTGKYLQKLRRIKFETFADKYINEYAKVNKKPNTVRRNKGSLTALTPHFKNKLIGSISPDMVEQYKKARLKNDIAPATINRDIDVLRNMMKRAVEWGYLSYNPLATVKHLKEDNEKMWVLTGDEEKRLLFECDKRPQRKKYLKDLVELALNTGMRQMELFNIKKNQVHLKDRYVQVIGTKTHENRNVPLNDMARAIIKKYLVGSPSEFLFCNEKGQKINYLTNAFWYAVKEAGLVYHEEVQRGAYKKVRFRFHDLRHTFGSRLGMGGVETKTIMEIMGHRTHKMAMRYQHPTPKHKLAAVKILEKSPPKVTTGKIIKLDK